MKIQTDTDFIEQLIERTGGRPQRILEILHGIQGHFGYLPKEALEKVCLLTEISASQLWGVATFYDEFRLKPAGRHLIKVCVGTACHVKGGQRVFEAFCRYLDIPDGGDTDPRGMFTVQKAACLGCCMLAPAVQIDKIIYGQLTAQKVPEVLRDFLDQQKPAEATEEKLMVACGTGELRVCLDSSCQAAGSAKVYAALKEAVHRAGASAAVKSVGCPGMSYAAPIVDVALGDGRLYRYGRVRPEEAGEIVLRHFRPVGMLGRLRNGWGMFLERLLEDRIGKPPVRFAAGVHDSAIDDYLAGQKHIATEHWGDMDPLNIEEYIAHGGFEGFLKCVKEKTPMQVIGEIERSGLRGRGGGGYPSHLKWAAVAKADAQQKYVVCNGDEGDPGAFMDRMLMESYPFRVLEGMITAARCVGASRGYLYIRAEYPLAVERMAKAIEICRRHGYLGENIFGSGFSFDLEICRGAGAFVCGEETALLASIEGRRGMPRLRPPYPAQQGLWGFPTLVNNVETFAVVPWIIRSGAKAFSSLGTAGSKGTKVFALAGKIVNGGLVEVPMGATIRQIVEGLGGGIAGGKKFKAVQIGGPSGGCVPAHLADTPIDYESLHQAGAIMGSGGLVVLDEDDCMVDIARYFLEFTQTQSCGRCTFCRVGTKRLLEMLEGLCRGENVDIERMESLAEQIRAGSLCGLGRTAANPVLSTLRHFRDEYTAHQQGKCPAKRCRSLIHFSITDKCIGCTICAQRCPAGAIEPRPYQRHEINQIKCVRCGTCRSVCPAEAVEVE